MADERPTRSLLAAEEVEDVLTWRPPSVDGDAVNASELDQIRMLRAAAKRAAEKSAEAVEVPPPMVTAEELAAIRKAAYDEGYAEGLAQGQAEGLRRGEQQMTEAQRRWTSLADALAEPLAGQAEAVEQQLVQLAVAMASQLVRREIHQDPGQIVAVIREAIAYLPLSRQIVRISLHPDDAAFVRQTFALDQGNLHSWHIIEDPTLSRGGCRMATEISNLDSTLETRLAALVAEMMGGERHVDA
ncbi:MAG: flagellar assembly protein FliH [Gammaproteobacteria bacterium]|nr:flagellar assembly protein FliH [Gammaproteobacteria bacterium]